MFLPRLLQSLNIKADVFSREEYKFAERHLVDTGYSKAHREAIGGLYTSFMRQIVVGVARDRGLEAHQVYLSCPSAVSVVCD